MYSVTYKYKSFGFDITTVNYYDYYLIVDVEAEDIADAADKARDIFRKDVSLFCKKIDPSTVVILHRLGIDFLDYCRKNIKQLNSINNLIDIAYPSDIINDWETIIEYMFKYIELYYDRLNNYYVPEDAISPNLLCLNRVKKTMVEEWIKNFVRENYEVLIEHIPLIVKELVQ